MDVSSPVWTTWLVDSAEFTNWGSKKAVRGIRPPTSLFQKEGCMELNGVANMNVILDLALMDAKIDLEYADLLRKQLVLMERYMVAASAHLTLNVEGEFLPAWHEIKANPLKYPTSRERNESK